LSIDKTWIKWVNKSIMLKNSTEIPPTILEQIGATKEGKNIKSPYQAVQDYLMLGKMVNDLSKYDSSTLSQENREKHSLYLSDLQNKFEEAQESISNVLNQKDPNFFDVYKESLEDFTDKNPKGDVAGNMDLKLKLLS
jgi:uncharacterized lipoprotein YddW (UPF0748 family)